MAARTIIAPPLARFHHPHPDVVLEDALAIRVVSRFDAGIRVGGQPEKDVVAVHPTPDLPSGRRTTWHVEERPSRLLKCMSTRASTGGSNGWQAPSLEFDKCGQRLEVAVGGPLATKGADIGIAAAANGLGVTHHVERDGVGA
ncbi:hypothetical protein [Xanthomonas phaseoli]|nr:hypothetical protein [Xanthomonas phaseoli]MCC8531241.1 hypothetical protein [Xanthomonas phaseoli]UEQ13365.1 hypothetical protein K9838_11425 [Xanthomonas phaseoli pv. manihotis]